MPDSVFAITKLSIFSLAEYILVMRNFFTFNCLISIFLDSHLRRFKVHQGSISRRKAKLAQLAAKLYSVSDLNNKMPAKIPLFIFLIF